MKKFCGKFKDVLGKFKPKRWDKEDVKLFVAMVIFIVVFVTYICLSLLNYK